MTKTKNEIVFDNKTMHTSCECQFYAITKSKKTKVAFEIWFCTQYDKI